ncbi:MAG TPA: hypothetical protein PKH07_03415 [bacterium]|nr:hypothetical protein [bacterium]
MTLLRFSLCLSLGVCLWMGVSTRAEAQRSLNDLTGAWQLFVDDYLVESSTNVKRVYHAFEKHAGNPVMKADKPWEGRNIYVYGTVLPEESGKGYRMWYHGLPEKKGDDPYRLLYATSKDGVSWEKPSLGIIEYEGSKDNNIYIRRNPRDHIQSVIHTPWESSPQRQYMMMNWSSDGYYLTWSPDGIHWTDVPNNPVLTKGGDVGNFCWDPRTKQYCGYVKLGSVVRDLKRRSVGFTSTSDPLQWPDPELIIEPDEIDDRWATPPARTQFYGFCAFPYETMYLGFLWLYRSYPTPADPEGYMDGVIYVELASSRDGKHWDRIAPAEDGLRPAILPLGAEGTWDSGMICTTNHPLVESNQIKLYYGGTLGTHYSASKDWVSAIGLATMRKDGFASLDAKGAIGVVTTKSLVGYAGKLYANFRSHSPAGCLRVEVLDEEGATVPGYGLADCVALTGDCPNSTVRWNGSSSLPATTSPIRLRFHVSDGSLYSFMAGSEVRLAEAPR